VPLETGVTLERPTPSQALWEPQDRKGSRELQVRLHVLNEYRVPLGRAHRVWVAVVTSRGERLCSVGGASSLWRASGWSLSSFFYFSLAGPCPLLQCVKDEPLAQRPLHPLCTPGIQDVPEPEGSLNHCLALCGSGPLEKMAHEQNSRLGSQY
jgi:hypothetical protein